MKARNTNRPSAGADRLGARLNACKHNLFTRTGCPAGPALRVQQLRDVYSAQAVTQHELAFHCELAEVQAHIEDIRRVRDALWQEMLEAAGLDERPEAGTGLSTERAPGNHQDRAEFQGIDNPILRGGDEYLDTVIRRLSTLAGYQRRATGRRRKLVREILRCRAQPPSARS